MENILSTTGGGPFGPYVRNYTLTVYWYLNSSIVYKDAFNLTKRGYNVEKSRHSRRNIRPSNISQQRQTSQRPLRKNMVVQRLDNRNRSRRYGLPRPHNSGPRPQDMDIHSRTRNPRSSQMDRRQNNTTMATHIREIHQIRLRPSLRRPQLNRWVYKDVTRSWDIPYPSYADGKMLDGWPYQPKPTGYDRCTKLHTRTPASSTVVSVWSDQLPIDPSLPQYGRGAWSAAAPSPATGTNYELVWTRLSTGDTFAATLPLRMDALRTSAV
jgi:hypothetical protein